MAQPVQLQIVFTRKQAKEQELKLKRREVKDLLESNYEYRELLEKITVLKAKRSEIEKNLENNNQQLYREIDALKLHLKTDKELVTDLAVRDFIDGKTVVVEDTYGNKYEPVWSVKFKQAQDLFNKG